MTFVKTEDLWCIIGHDNKGRPTVLCAEADTLPENICKKENENIDRFKELVVKEATNISTFNIKTFEEIFRGSPGFFEVHYGKDVDVIVKGGDEGLEGLSINDDGVIVRFKGSWD